MIPGDVKTEQWPCTLCGCEGGDNESCKVNGLNMFKAGAEEKKTGDPKKPKLAFSLIFIHF